VLKVEVGAIASNNTRGIMLPGKSALAVRMFPRKERVVELTRRVKLSVNRAIVTAGLATVARVMIAIEETFLAFIDAVSGPAIFIRVVVDGVPEREGTKDFVANAFTISHDSGVINAITISINPGITVDILRPITTVALRSNSVSTEVDVVSGSKSRNTELAAIVGRARVIIALPVLLIQHTSVGDERSTCIRADSSVVEFALEALTLIRSRSEDSTSTNTNTSSPVTVARGGASRPSRPVTEDTSSPVAGTSCASLLSAS